MARTSTIHDDNDGNAILIERREIVAQINPDPYANQSMLTAAYHAIGEYMTEYGGGTKGFGVEFVYRGARFTAEYSPEPERNPVE